MPIDSISHEINPKSFSSKEQQNKSQEWLTINKDSENYRDIIKNTIIKGDPLAGYTSDIENLDYQNLGPKYYTKIGEKQICLSETYSLNNGRPVVVGFIFNEKINKWETKSYYRSQSQGLWRYLPSYSFAKDGYSIESYSKGKNGEDSLNLPFFMQEKLSEISKNPKKDIINPERLMVSLSLNKEKHKNIKDERSEHFEFNEVIKKKMTEFLPNSKKKISEFYFQSSLYGNVNAKIFESFNARVHYLICSNEKGQIWVGGIEYKYNNPINNNGLPEKWVQTRGLTTPAMEYSSQAGKYADNKYKKGSYVSVSKPNIILNSLKR